MFQAGGFEITQDLSLVFVDQGFRGLQFHYQFALHQQVGQVVADERAIFVIDLDRMLLFDVEPRLAQPVRQGVFIHLLQVPVPVIDVDGIGNLPDLIAQCLDVFHLPVI